MLFIPKNYLKVLYTAYSRHQFFKIFSAPATNCPSFKVALGPPLDRTKIKEIFKIFAAVKEDEIAQFAYRLGEKLDDNGNMVDENIETDYHVIQELQKCEAQKAEAKKATVPRPRPPPWCFSLKTISGFISHSLAFFLVMKTQLDFFFIHNSQPSRFTPIPRLCPM